MVTSLKNRDNNIETLKKRIDLINYIYSNLKDYYNKEGTIKYFIEGMKINEIIKSITKKEFRRIYTKYNFNILE